MIQIAFILVFRAISRRFHKLLIAFCGVAIAVASLVLLEAIMEGVGDAMIDNTVSIHHGHIACRWQGAPAEITTVAEALPDGSSILRRRCFTGILSAGPRRCSLALYGIEPEHERRRTVVAAKLVAGEYLGFPESIVLGGGAARQLEVGVGSGLQLAVPGEPPRRLVVAGIYRTGMEWLDARAAFIRYDEAPAGEHELAIFLEQGSGSVAASAVLKEVLPELAPKPWQDDMGELVQLVTLNQVAMNVVLLLALVILSFGISNTVYISITDRIREFGILRAMGMRSVMIQMVVMLEVLVLIVMAGGVGLALGAAGSEILGRTGLDLARWTSENPHFLASGMIYPRITLRALLLPGLVALVCAAIAAWLPSRRAGNVRVIEALRMV